jgi:hypothetical protein
LYLIRLFICLVARRFQYAESEENAANAGEPHFAVTPALCPTNINITPGCSGHHALYITYSVGCFINYLKSNIEQMFTSKTCAQVKSEFEFLLASSVSDSYNASPIYKPMLFLHSFRYNYCEKASQNK